ncbi:MAG TPA: hypothetical protein VLB29_13335 [Nocardioidaceae bacterium]|nr:hypothetical protein [Nocardioidaceae bacterium]
MEPDAPSRRLMSVRGRARAVASLLSLLALVASCAGDEQAAAPCTLDASITFDGHAYIPVDSLPGLAGGKVRVGERLGTGELTTCQGEPERNVEVYKVVGIPAERAVFSKPEHGLMRRLRPGEAIE